MKLPYYKSEDLSLTLLQTAWGKIINPIISLPTNNGIFIKGINLVTGDNIVSHKLQRNLQGYIVTSMYNSYSNIYTKVSKQPTLNLILNASAPTTIDLWVY